MTVRRGLRAGAAVLVSGAAPITLLACTNDYAPFSVAQGSSSASATASSSSTGGQGGAGTAGGAGSGGKAAAGGSGGAYCGNGVVDDPSEECDDKTSGCDADCHVVCDGLNELKPAPLTHCYKLMKGVTSTWDEAEQSCVAWNPHARLASIPSAAELSPFPSLSGAYVWLGARDVNADKLFEWVSGEPFDFANWDTGQLEPDHQPMEDCVAVYGNTFWHDRPCSDAIGYMCEYPYK